MLVLVTGVIGLPPKVNPNLLALLPDHEPSVQALRSLHSEEGGVNLLTLAFESEDPAKLEPFLDQLTADLEAMDKVAFALHKVDPDLATQVGLMQLEANEIKELTNRLKGALALGPAMNPFVAGKLMEMGPLTEKIGQSNKNALLPQGREGVGKILVRPTGSAVDNPFAVALMKDVEALLERHLTDNPGIELEWMGGAYRHNVEDMKGIQQDIVWTTGASVFLVLMVMILSFRGFRAPILVFVPLIAANIVNLGLVRITMGSLNTYTSLGTAILIGLGIDFAVHLMARYREFRSNGLDVNDAIVSAWDKTGPPCATAAFTSAAAFLALAAAGFQGFSQMGILLAMGLMVCLAAMLTGLPLLIAVLDPNPPKPMSRSSFSGKSSYTFAPLALTLLVFATAAIGIFKLPNIEWEFDISNLRRDGLSYTQLTEEEQMLAKESYSPIIVSYPNDRRLNRAQKRIRAAIRSGEVPHLRAAISILDAIPPDQAPKLEALHELQKQLVHPNMKYLPPPVVKPLLPIKDLTLDPITRDRLGAPVRMLLGATQENTHRLLLFPGGNMWDLRETAELEKEVGMMVRKSPAAGEYVAMGALYRTVIRDMPIVGGLALLMVAMLTALDLKSPVRIAGALGTLLAGMVWTGAALQMSGVKLSLLNVVGIPILLGIGVDVIIHLLHRLHEEGPGGVRRALSTTGVAAGISTLTTILSFFSLSFAGNRGVRSLGMLVVIGLCAIFLATALLLPVAWAAGWKISGQAPDDNQ